MFAAGFFGFVRSAHDDARLRLAPTPSGFLHAGNAVNFILNWLAARASGGRLLLRIDDLDAARKRPEFLEDIYESLLWLQLDWDDGPRGNSATEFLNDFEANWSQQRRMPLYNKLLEELRARKLLFACRLSRTELAAYPEYPEHRSTGTHRSTRRMSPGGCTLPA